MAYYWGYLFANLVISCQYLVQPNHFSGDSGIFTFHCIRCRCLHICGWVRSDRSQKDFFDLYSTLGVLYFGINNRDGRFDFNSRIGPAGRPTPYQLCQVFG